jgi:hypothetical protein
MIFVLGLSVIVVNLIFLLKNKEGYEENKVSEELSILKLLDSTIDTSNNLLVNENMTNDENDENDDNNSISNFMEDKTILKKLNSNVMDNIKNMKSNTSIEEFNEKINQLHNIKDP